MPRTRMKNRATPRRPPNWPWMATGAGRRTRLEPAQAVRDSASAARLADTLQADVQGILKRCTMTGPGHDMLHRYFGILFADIERLRSASAADFEAAQARLRADVLMFERYFE